MFVLQTHIFYSAKKQHADKEKSHARDVPTVRLQKRKNIMDQKYSVEVPDLGIQISTGSIAKQANGSVTISMGETNLLVTATAAGALRDGQDFFPLTVDYRETFSAAGKIPGGYFKREGRPNEKEILTSRLCDRPLRPLFPNCFMN